MALRKLLLLFLSIIVFCSPVHAQKGWRGFVDGIDAQFLIDALKKDFVFYARSQGLADGIDRELLRLGSPTLENILARMAILRAGLAPPLKALPALHPRHSALLKSATRADVIAREVTKKIQWEIEERHKARSERQSPLKVDIEEVESAARKALPPTMSIQNFHAGRDGRAVITVTLNGISVNSAFQWRNQFEKNTGFKLRVEFENDETKKLLESGDELGIVLPTATVHNPIPKQAPVPKEVLEKSNDRHVFWNREDFTKIPTFSIDRAGTAIRDDAFSVIPLAGGGAKILVHITDVSEIVLPGSEMDIAAKKVGKSSFVENSKISLLPYAIETKVANLLLGENRPVITMALELDLHGQIRDVRFSKGVINLQRAYSFEEFLNKAGALPEEVFFLALAADKISKLHPDGRPLSPQDLFEDREIVRAFLGLYRERAVAFCEQKGIGAINPLEIGLPGFTSPLRSYDSLFNQRNLAKLLDGESVDPVSVQIAQKEQLQLVPEQQGLSQRVRISERIRQTRDTREFPANLFSVSLTKIILKSRTGQNILLNEADIEVLELLPRHSRVLILTVNRVFIPGDPVQVKYMAFNIKRDIGIVDIVGCAEAL